MDSRTGSVTGCCCGCSTTVSFPLIERFLAGDVTGPVVGGRVNGILMRSTGVGGGGALDE